MLQTQSWLYSFEPTEQAHSYGTFFIEIRPELTELRYFFHFDLPTLKAHATKNSANLAMIILILTGLTRRIW